jgi:hypothetical protein
MQIHLLAADWGDFIGIVAVVVAVLSWVVSQFSGEAVKKGPQRERERPAPPPEEEAEINLQTEIDEFVRQQRNEREGRSAPDRERTAPDRPQRGRPARRQSGEGKRGSSRRQGQRPPPLPNATAEPTIVELVEDAPRETVAEHVAHALGTTQLDNVSRPRSQFQQASDADFHGHMERVFNRDLGNLKTASGGTGGIFETAAAASVAAGVAATPTADPNNRSASAPQTTKKAAADIAVFLASRKNARDAIILSEIINRPEHRW